MSRPIVFLQLELPIQSKLNILKSLMFLCKEYANARIDTEMIGGSEIMSDCLPGGVLTSDKRFSSDITIMDTESQRHGGVLLLMFLLLPLLIALYQVAIKRPRAFLCFEK